MLDLSKKVILQPFICNVIFINDGNILPLSGSSIQQNFYDTVIKDGNYQKFYNSKGQVRFSESSSESRSGYFYTQSLNVSFPDGDLHRSERLAAIQKVKHIAIELTNGKFFIIGRNDAYQNTAPKKRIQANERRTAVRFTVISTTPTGYINLTGTNGFPYLIPSTT